MEKNKDWKEEIARIFREGTSGEIENEDGEKTSWSFEFPDEQYTELLRLIDREIEEAERRGKEEAFTNRELSYLDRLMILERWGEDETVKTEQNTINGDEWLALQHKISVLTSKEEKK